MSCEYLGRIAGLTKDVVVVVVVEVVVEVVVVEGQELVDDQTDLQSLVFLAISEVVVVVVDDGVHRCC